jgi:hypothetical protein
MAGGRHTTGQPEGDAATRRPSHQCGGISGVGVADNRTRDCCGKRVVPHTHRRRGLLGSAEYVGVLVAIIAILAAFTINNWPSLGMRWPRASMIFSGESTVASRDPNFDADMNPKLRRIMTSSGVIDTINTPVCV